MTTSLGDLDAVKRRTNWMFEGKLGLTTHYFPRSREEIEEVADRFDVQRVAEQCEEAGVAWFMLTLHHQPWLMQAPNATLDRITGSSAFTASRDLPMELHEALSKRGIRMMLYLNLRIDPESVCQPEVLQALGPCPPVDETIDRVADVYREFANRYGDRVAGWWVDGVWTKYFKKQPVEQLSHWFDTLTSTLRLGNPDAAIAFNPGIPDALCRYTLQNDYLAGEANDLREPPTTRFADGAQWHVWPHLGHSWGSGGLQFDDASLCMWAQRVVQAGGVMSFDVGTRGLTKSSLLDPDPIMEGPVGAIDPRQVEQIGRVSRAIHR